MKVIVTFTDAREFVAICDSVPVPGENFVLCDGAGEQNYNVRRRGTRLAAEGAVDVIEVTKANPGTIKRVYIK